MLLTYIAAHIKDEQNWMYSLLASCPKKTRNHVTDFSRRRALVRFFRRKDPKVRTRIVCESQVCDAVRRFR